MPGIKIGSLPCFIFGVISLERISQWNLVHSITFICFEIFGRHVQVYQVKAACQV